MEDDAIALEAYEMLAERYAARVDTKAHNAYYERPATLSLLPSVEGKRVLDAGCGPGVYAEWLVDHGAEVVAFDVSPKMVRLARDRLQGRARIMEADIGRPLDFLESGSFDQVLSPLALDYVRDWGTAFREFHRVLRRPGHFVPSVWHPSDDFYAHHPDGNYFDIERVENTFSGFGTPVQVPSYRRSLSAMLDPLFGADFVLERLLEPTPIGAFEDQDPEDYRKLMREPGILCIRASKRVA